MSEQINEREPYVGPRPFERDESEFFFGREVEVDDLISLVTANQVVLLYAQSGAGKTSLLRASLIPKLEEERFKVVGPARVRMQENLEISIDDITNIFVFNALSYWNEGRFPQSELANMSLKTFIEKHRESLGEDDSTSFVIVFDQFEEIFTHHLDRWEDRREFFKQVSNMLKEDTQLRVLFVMREDYIAELDPYAEELPGKLRTRFRMEQLRRSSALKAITKPLTAPSMKAEGFTFAPGVAEALVDDLMEIRVQTPTGERHVAGQFVEPVQLQVVCQELWHAVKSTSNGSDSEGKKTITIEHLKDFGDVNTALTKFYERTINHAAEASGWSEGALRRWFDRHLITPDGNRSTVLRGRDRTAGLPNAAIDVFEAERLLRSEPRDGRLWYELGQDRLIKPIQNSYKEWLKKQKGDEKSRVELENQAEQWLQSNRDNRFLLNAGQILLAKRFGERDASGSLSDTLYSLIQESETQIARDEREQVRKLAEEQRLRAEAETARAAALEVAAVEQQQRAEEQRLRAEAETARAAALEVAAAEQRQRAEEQRQRAEEQRQRAEEKTRANRRLRFALAAVIVGVLVSAGLGLTALHQRAVARRERDLAEARKIEAQVERDRAQTSAEEADKQRKLAEANATEANNQRKLAEANATEADNQRKLAQANATEADNQRKLAEANATEANIQKELAEENAKEARRQEAIANEKTIEAERNKTKAENEAKLAREAENKARVQGERSKSLALAAHAVGQLNKDPELALLLASEAAKIPNAPKEARDALLEALDQSRIISVINTPSPALAAAFDNNGRVLTAGPDNKVQSWNVLNDRAPQTSIATLQGPSAQAQVVTFTSDAKFAMSIVDDNSMQLWRIDGETLNFLLTDKEARIRKAVANQSGSYALTISDNELTRVWDVQRQRIVAYLVPDREPVVVDGVPKQDPVANVRFSPNGKFAVTAQGKDAYLWEVLDEWHAEDSPDRIRFPKFVMKGHVKQVNAASVSDRDGSVVTASEDGTARLWDDKGNLLFQLGHEAPVRDAAFSPNGLLIVTASSDGTARVWNTRGSIEAVLRGHKGPLRSAAFHSDNRTIVTTSDDGTTRVWQLSEQKRSTLYKHEAEVSGIAISKEGGFIVTGSYDDTAIIWDLTSRKRTVLRSSDPVIKVVISPDGKYVAAASRGGAVGLWDSENNRLTASLLDHPSEISGIAFSPDGKTIATSTIFSGVRIWEVPSGRLLSTIDSPEKVVVTAISFSPNGRFLAIVHSDHNGTVRLHELATKNERVLSSPWRDPEGLSQVMTASFSPRDDRLVVTSSLGSLYITDASLVPASDPIVVLRERPSPSGAVFSNDGKYIAAWGDDRIRIYDAATGAKLKTLLGHTDLVTGAVFSTDNRLLVTVSVDKTARVWDVESGIESTTLAGHDKQVSGAVFTPNNAKIITTSYDGSVLMFDCSICGSTDSILATLQDRFGEKMREEAKKFMLTSSDSCGECGDLPELLKRAQKQLTRQFTEGELLNFHVNDAKESPTQPN